MDKQELDYKKQIEFQLKDKGNIYIKDGEVWHKGVFVGTILGYLQAGENKK